MGSHEIDKERGKRLRQAMLVRGHRKALALAVELNISPAAITKWKQGHAMSVGNACKLARSLNVSLDWLLLGRNGPDWVHPNQMSALESDLVESSRALPIRVAELLVELLSEIQRR
ncbi:helix-turn-helix transcriptional regulator [uncultured Roseibium sp.]|uniref:helix-turn-helix domain-containing protein n=1 Tax=uncultured Roseibium sp. TaxID=1936171 RepID=UPI0026263A0C|nr:helix-turn-helix transcriptional regulator [uncultured Roseibium sp.]